MKQYFTLLDPVVPMQHPRLIIETAVSQGAGRDQLLDGVGFTAATLEIPEARISYNQLAVLIKNALKLTENPALGLDVGANLQLSHMGVLGLALMSSPNLKTALETGLRHYRTLSPHWDLELSFDGSRARLLARETITLRPFKVFATEAMLTSFYALAWRLAGSPKPYLELELNYARPDHAARYAEFCASPPRFDAPLTLAQFDAATLQAPIAGAEPATRNLAEQLCNSQGSAAPQAPGIVAQVRRLLGASGAAPRGLEQVARELRTSSRSLRRDLQQAGTSYQALLEEERRERALQLVRSTQLSLEEISKHVGFSDVRSFRRAFKRWTGRTPNSIRSVGNER